MVRLHWLCWDLSGIRLQPIQARLDGASGYDECMDDFLLASLGLTDDEVDCIKMDGAVYAEVLGLQYNNELVDPCDPSKSPEDILGDAITGMCAGGGDPSVERLYENLEAQIEHAISNCLRACWEILICIKVDAPKTN